MYMYISLYICIGIKLDDTNIAPYCSLINNKAKKLSKIHQKRKLTIKACLSITILLINCNDNNSMMTCIH